MGVRTASVHACNAHASERALTQLLHQSPPRTSGMHNSPLSLHPLARTFRNSAGVLASAAGAAAAAALSAMDQPCPLAALALARHGQGAGLGQEAAEARRGSPACLDAEVWPSAV